MGIPTLLPNPNVKDLKRKFGQLRRLPLCDEERSGDQLPAHIILGAQIIRGLVRRLSPRKPVFGVNSDQDPGAEYTMLEWVLCERIPSNDMQVDKEFFLSSSQSEFEKLCSSDVLGLTDKQQNLSESQFHQDFANT